MGENISGGGFGVGVFLASELEIEFSNEKWRSQW